VSVPRRERIHHRSRRSSRPRHTGQPCRKAVRGREVDVLLHGHQVRRGQPLVLAGQASLSAQTPRLRTLTVVSDPIRASAFRGPRVLSAWFRQVEGSPRVYLGFEYLDREGQVLGMGYPGGQAVALPAQETVMLRSPPLEPADFPEGTERVRVLLTLGRITGGEVMVDEVSLVPGEELERKVAALLPNGGLEEDADGDGVPDGFELASGRRDDLDFAEGFSSVKLEGGAGAASLTSPLIPVSQGETYAFGVLARSDEPDLRARIQWFGYGRDRQPLPASPPPREFTPGAEWRIARDTMKIAPPPGTPEVAWVRIRVEADLPPRGALWLDDLRFEQASEEESKTRSALNGSTDTSI